MNHKKKIVLFTQWFEPEPTFKGLLFARELQVKGFEVYVVTGFPNYPGGKIYPGYRIRLFQSEMLEGINIFRLPLYPSHDRSAFRRVLNYCSFCLSLTIFGIFFMPKVDAIYAYHPPLTVGIAAVLTKLFRRIPIIYDIQDLWPDTLLATNMITNVYFIRLIGFICHLVYRFADKIVVLSPGFKRLLVKRNVPCHKITVIFNWANESAHHLSKASSSALVPEPLLDLDDSFIILFAGNVGKAQSLSTVVKAASITLSKSVNVKWVIVGSGLEFDYIKSLIHDHKLTNVLILPRVPMIEITSYFDRADALLVHLRDDPLFEITIPSKIQAYMLAGKPLLAALSGDAASLVSEARCGLVVSPEDPSELAEAAIRLSQLPQDQLQVMSDNSKLFYTSRLSLTVGCEKFVELFNELIP